MITLLVGFTALAVDFTEGKLAYEIINKDESSVVGLADYSDKFLDDVNGHIVVPSYVEKDGKYYKVTCIRGFENTKLLYGVTIPSTVKTISKNAFYKSSVTNVVFEGTSELTTIEKNAFGECLALERIEIPESVIKMGSGVFKGCRNLKQVEFNASVSSISAECFVDCVSLEDLNLSPVVQTIGKNAFERCKNLKPDFLTGNIRIYENDCFKGCENFKRLELPEGLVWIGDNVFLNCPELLYIGFPTTLKHVGESVVSADSDNLKLINFKGYVEVQDLMKTFPCKNVNFVVSSNTNPSDAIPFIVSDDEFKIMVFEPNVSDKQFYMSLDGKVNPASDNTIILGPFSKDYDSNYSESAIGLYLRNDIKPSFGWIQEDSYMLTPVNLHPIQLELSHYDFEISGSDKMGTGFTVEHFESYQTIISLKQVTAGVNQQKLQENTAGTSYEVFNMDGIKVGSGLSRSDIEALPAGFYLVRSGNKTIKIVR